MHKKFGPNGCGTGEDLVHPNHTASNLNHFACGRMVLIQLLARDAFLLTFTSCSLSCQSSSLHSTLSRSYVMIDRDVFFAIDVIRAVSYCYHPVEIGDSLLKC